MGGEQRGRLIGQALYFDWVPFLTAEEQRASQAPSRLKSHGRYGRFDLGLSGRSGPPVTATLQSQRSDTRGQQTGVGSTAGYKLDQDEAVILKDDTVLDGANSRSRDSFELALTNRKLILIKTMTKKGGSHGTSTEAANWQPDLKGVHRFRWWDGDMWTPQVADNGVTGRDPL